MHIPIYRAIDWIAHNDEDSCMDVEAVRLSVTVALVADLFGKDQTDIAERVVKRREEIERDWDG
jgi:hypothetical protein